MKKAISLITAAVLLICMFSVCASAKVADNGECSDAFSAIAIDGAEKCFIRNEFYTLFADEYFEEIYNDYLKTYNSWVTYSDMAKEGASSSMLMKEDSKGVEKASLLFFDDVQKSDDLFYVTVIFNYKDSFSEEKNRTLAEKLYDGIEVLYAGKTTPCAVVTVKGGTDEFSKIIENENTALVTNGMVPYSGKSVSPCLLEETYTPTANDARKVLRYSAKLDKAPTTLSEAKQFFFKNDIDGDGKLTSADARLVLRIAAGIDAPHSFFKSFCDFWEM